MEIDAVGTFTMSRAAFSALRASKESVVINISATLHYGATWYQVRVELGRGLAVRSVLCTLCSVSTNITHDSPGGVGLAGACLRSQGSG